MRRHHDGMHSSGSRVGTFAGLALLPLFIAWTDLTTNTQMIGLATASMSLPFVNPPPKNNGDKRLQVSPVPLFVRLKWPDGYPHDLDLWVRCYNLANGQKTNGITIGYSRTSQGWLDLLRDDQGLPSYINEEHIQSNSEVSRIPSNTWCQFNAHLYHSRGGVLPVKADLLVIQNKDGDDEVLVGHIKFELSVPGQERTVLIAAWDEHGNLLKDSVTTYSDATDIPIATAR